MESPLSHVSEISVSEISRPDTRSCFLATSRVQIALGTTMTRMRYRSSVTAPHCCNQHSGRNRARVHYLKAGSGQIARVRVLYPARACAAHHESC